MCLTTLNLYLIRYVMPLAFMISIQKPYSVPRCISHYFVLFIFCLCIHSVSYAQDNKQVEINISTSEGEQKVLFIIEYLREGNRYTPEKSISYAETALEIIGENHEKKAVILTYLALSKYHLDEFDKSRELLKIALLLTRQQQNQEDEMLVLLSFAMVDNELRNHTLAMSYINTGLEIAKSLNNLQLMGDFNRLKGTIYSDSYQYSKAIEASLLALQYFTTMNNTADRVVALKNCAGVYRSLAAFDKALEYQLRALSLILTTNDEKKIAINYNNTAILYKDLQDYDNAIAMHHKSLAIKESIGYLRGQVYSHNNLGEAYRLEGDKEASLQHLSEAAVIAKKINSQKLLNYSYLYLGRLHRDRGEFNKAQAYLLDAIKYFTKTNRTSRLSETYLALGRLYLEQGEYRSAVDKIKLSMRLAIESNKIIVIFEAYKNLSILYEKLEDFKSALKNEKEFQRQKDIIFNVQRQHYIQTIQVEYNVEQKQREIIALTQKNTISALEIEQQIASRNIYIISSLLFFSLFGFFSYRYNQKKKLESKRIALMQIQAKERDLIELNINLESIVTQRTQSLLSSNESLETTLLDLKNTQKNLIEVEKMASLSKLVAGVAHEVNTPLGTVITAVSFLNQKLSDFKQKVINNNLSREGLDKFLATVTQSTDIIKNNASRSAELIKEFKQVAVEERTDPPKQFLLVECIDSAMQSLQVMPLFKRVDYSINVIGNSQITSYSTYWFQILESLLTNTVIHGFKDNKQPIKVGLFIEERDNQVNVTYTDNGCGVEKSMIKDIFEPFCTTLRHQGHAGLGLHITYNMVSQTLGGAMRYQAPDGESSGACFIIELPKKLNKVTQ